MFLIIISLFGLICSSQAQTEDESIIELEKISLIIHEARINMLEVGQIPKCEGKDPANYTWINPYTLNSACDPYSNQAPTSGTHYLIACSSNGQLTVNTLNILSLAKYPAGAYYQFEILYLVTSGNLQGKYVYFKEIDILESYLKKCSSVLGQSYVPTLSLVMLIADKLDLNVFLNPAGAFEPFKKSAATMCTGMTYTF